MLTSALLFSWDQFLPASSQGLWALRSQAHCHDVYLGNVHIPLFRGTVAHLILSPVFVFEAQELLKVIGSVLVPSEGGVTLNPMEFRFAVSLDEKNMAQF